MTDNTQEIDEILERLYRIAADTELKADRFDPYAFDGVAEAKQAILDWHNKQVEEAMAKFHLKKGVKYDVKASDSVIVITYTNKLKESSDEL